ncbi:MAG: heavy-metal-associated domain-containing protein [Chitinophagaceae bacterium]
MTHTYQITGMTCGNCVARVKSELLKLGDVLSAEIQLPSPQAAITMNKHISTVTLQQAVSKAGHYTIAEVDEGMTGTMHAVKDETVGKDSYFPIILIFSYITGITLLIQMVQGFFNWMQWMNHFMAGFFLVFSFFKIMNLQGFAESYSMYDIVAKKWKGWGYVYAFTELALGIAFLTSFNPILTNAVTFVIMTVSIIGVLQSVLNKRKIKCACLGAVFNLPMSTITVIEDALMIGMSGVMLVTML